MSADARGAKQRERAEEQAMEAQEEEREALAAMKVEKDKLAAKLRAAEEREAARVADVASEQRELTDTTLGAMKDFLHDLFQWGVVLEGSQLRDFGAVLKQMLTLGDLGNGGSVEQRLGLIKQIVDSIHSDFETAAPTAGTLHDPLGAGRGVLAAGYGAAISECLGALLTLRRLTVPGRAMEAAGGVQTKGCGCRGRCR